MDKLVQNMRKSTGGGQIDLMADIIEKLYVRVKELETKVETLVGEKAAKTAKGK